MAIQLPKSKVHLPYKISFFELDKKLTLFPVILPRVILK